MRNENDSFALLDEVAQHGKKFVGLLWCQHAGGFVHHQNIGPAIEHFQDLDALLLSHR